MKEIWCKMIINEQLIFCRKNCYQSKKYVCFNKIEVKMQNEKISACVCLHLLSSRKFRKILGTSATYSLLKAAFVEFASF